MHHCYVRASVATERLPAFSMMVNKPEFGDPDLAGRIKKEAAAYLRSAEDLAAQQDEWQREIDELAAEASKAQEQPEAPVVPSPEKKSRN